MPQRRDVGSTFATSSGSNDDNNRIMGVMADFTPDTHTPSKCADGLLPKLRTIETGVEIDDLSFEVRMNQDLSENDLTEIKRATEAASLVIAITSAPAATQTSLSG